MTDASHGLSDVDRALIELYLDDMGWRRLSINTINIRRTYLMKLARELGPLAGVKPKRLRAWLADTERDLKASTQSILLTTYHCFYEWAIKERHLKKDPTLRVDTPKVAKGFPHPITDEDLDKALANADGRMRCWLSLGAFAGGRCCEIATVSREDVYDDASMRLFWAHTKGDKPRSVPLNPKLLYALNNWGMPTSGPLWGEMTAQNMSKAVNAYLHSLDAKRDDGKPATAHCLRHWYGSTLYKLTRDIVMVKELMGHESVGTTQIYAGTDLSKMAGFVGML